MIYFLGYPILFPLLRLLLRLLGRLKSSGEENVPPRGGVLLCPNHLSDSDPPTLFVTTPRRAWFVGKRELFEIPVLGWFFSHFHAFPIERDSADRAALRRIEAHLRAGEAVVVFPEGRLSETGTLQRVQPGAALLALRTGTPIVPVGLENTNGVLPYGDLIPRFSPRPVTVTFGPPLRPQAFAHLPRRAAVAAMTEALGRELARLTDQPPPAPEKTLDKARDEPRQGLNPNLTQA